MKDLKKFTSKEVIFCSNYLEVLAIAKQMHDAKINWYNTEPFFYQNNFNAINVELIKELIDSNDFVWIPKKNMYYSLAKAKNAGCFVHLAIDYIDPDADYEFGGSISPEVYVSKSYYPKNWIGGQRLKGTMGYLNWKYAVLSPCEFGNVL